MIYLCTIDGEMGLLTHFFYENKIIKAVTTCDVDDVVDVISFDTITSKSKRFEMIDDFEFVLPSKLDMIKYYTGNIYDLCENIVLTKILNEI